jgi:hypothetical protein
MYLSTRIENFGSSTVGFDGVSAASGPIKNHHWRLATYADLLVICLREITLAVEDHSGNSADGQDIGYASAELETITSLREALEQF